MSRDGVFFSGLGALLVVVAALIVAWGLSFFSTMPRTLTHLSFGSSSDPSFALSPDGTTVAYTAEFGDDVQLFVRRLDGARPHRLPETEGASAPFFSPDGARVGFIVRDRIELAPLAGGSPRVLCDVSALAGVAWTGRGIVVGTRSGLVLVAETGDERPLTSLAKDETAHRFPEPIPGTDWVLFEVETHRANPSRVDVVSMATGERRTLVERGAMPRWAPAGHLLFRRGRSLWAVDLDPDAAKRLGVPSLVVEAAGAWYDVSTNGTLALEEPRRGNAPIIVSIMVHWVGELKRLGRQRVRGSGSAR